MSPPCCASCDILPALSSLNPPQNPNITPFPNTSFTPQHPCPTEPQRVLYSAYPPDAHDCTYTQLGTNYAKISFTRSLLTQAHVRVRAHTISALMFYAPPSLSRFKTHGLRASVPSEKKSKWNERDKAIMKEEVACCAITLSLPLSWYEGGIRVFMFVLSSFTSPADSPSLDYCHPACLAVHLFVWQQLHPPSIFLLMFTLVPDELISLKT